MQQRMILLCLTEKPGDLFSNRLLLTANCLKKLINRGNILFLALN
jgi:hypothetical protein